MDNSGFDLILQSLPQLVKGTGVTLNIALSAIVWSTLGGIVFGVLRTSRLFIVQALTRAYIEVFRAIPILVWLFLIFFGLPILTGINIPSAAAAILALSLWGVTEIGEIVRGALQSVSKGQREAGTSIGLSRLQLFAYVLFPQAVRRMIPSTINIYTRIIKTTSLTVLIGVTEMIKSGQQIIERTGEALVIYSCLFVFYFALCYPLSAWSRRLENRWAA